MNLQAGIIRVYRFFTGIVFNIAIIILLFSLFVGLVRTITELRLTFTEETV